MYDIDKLTISSTNPCLVVYLIDQSASMDEKFGNASHSKAEEVAEAINDTIYEMGLRCISSNGDLKNRFEVAVIGYGKENNKVSSGWQGKLSSKWVVSIKDIFDNPLTLKDSKPVWITPIANTNTPMTKAFESAKRLCYDWINWGNHRDSHPPIIINITDGEATDAGGGFNLLRREIEELKHLSTNYGGVIVLNIHISSKPGEKVLYPKDPPRNDVTGTVMFDLSSQLTPNMIRIARQVGYTVEDGAKGYVNNGNASDLMNFLNIGTPH